MKTAEYWAERSTMQMDRGMLAADKTVAQLTKEYNRARREICGEINGLYAQYGDKYGLSYAEAAKSIGQSAYTDWRMTVAEYVDRIAETGDDALQVELDTLATRSRVSRLETVDAAIKVNVAELRAKEEALVRELLDNTYTQAVYRQVYDIQQGLGFGQVLEMLAPAQVAKVLAYPWSGAKFSDRIWTDKRLLSEQLQRTLTQGLVQGKGITPMARQLDEVLGAGRYNSERLIRTETAYAVEQGSLQGYREMEIEEYDILATLDLRTSKICQGQDGKRYKVAEAVVSKNYPPFHPNCRTTTVPYFGEGYDAGTRRAKLGGEYFEVPSSMKYDEWFKQYVKKAA